MRRKSFTSITGLAAVAATLGLAFATPAALAKEQGDWMIRARGLVVTPDESATISPIGGTAAVGNEATVELDFSYFVSDNIAVELILATTKHSVSARGTALGDLDLGHVWLLPPVLTLQYHFAPNKQISPYLGAGINMTLFHSENAGPVVAGIDYDTAFGIALQAGVDIQVGERSYINLDLKKVWMGTDVTIDAGALGIVNADVDLNPWIFGVGVGYRF